MNFDLRPRRPARGENIVPMINVVFLLLIFFLMSAQIAPRDPFDIVLPDSESGRDTPAEDTLFVSRQGALAFAGATGQAALRAIAARAQDEPLTIRADAGVPAATIAALLPQLAEAGVTQTLIATGLR